MDQVKLRIAFLRGFYDARDDFSHPTVDYGGDPDLHKAWEAGQKHFNAIIDAEAVRLEHASKDGDGFPAWLLPHPLPG